MALELKLSLVSVDYNQNTFHIQNTTGFYSTLNPGGYGSPNYPNEPSDNNYMDPGVYGNGLDQFLLTVTRPDGTTFTKDVTAISQLSGQIASNDYVNYPVTDSVDIVNGVYTFKLVTYRYQGKINSLPILREYLSTELEVQTFDLSAIELAINTKFAIDLDFCNFPDSACNKSLLVLWSYYRALKAAVEEQNSVKANYLSTQILKIIG